MSDRNICKRGEPVLVRKARSVPAAVLKRPDFGTLVRRMARIMREANGVGLAANQIGLPLRLIVLENAGSPRYPAADRFPLRVYVNPRLVDLSRERVAGWEGCLSIPGYRGEVRRHRRLRLLALDARGARVDRVVSGFEARVLQHEVDHINGLFYMDRMPDLRRWFHLESFRPARSAKRARVQRRRTSR